MEKKILSGLPFLLCLFLTATKAAALPSPPVTISQVQASQCGSTLSAVNSNITATLVSGAAAYRFKVTSVGEGGQEQTIERPNRTFNLTQLPSYAFATTYYIQVSVKVQNVWKPYGPQCSVTSPSPLTKITGNQCGITLSSISDVIYANNVPLAPGYRFRITNVLNPLEVYTVDRQLRELRMNLIPAGSGATYAVDVAVKNFNGNYLPYGEQCGITTPVLYTKIQQSQCGTMLGALSDDVFADLVPNCQGYRFRVTKLTTPGQTQVINKTLRTFTMAQLTGIQYNTPYKVEVSIKDSHGDYLAYGQQCTVITPGLPIPKIQLSQCELVSSSTTELIYADDYPGATAYRFRLENPEVGYSHYIDRTQRNYSLNMFSGLLPGTAYTVKVAVKVNGSFTPYGKACDVTTPAALGRENVDANQMVDDNGSVLSAFPNPFSEYFNIAASHPLTDQITVRMYDMTGRLLAAHKIEYRELASIQLGTNFPPGIYNVVMMHGDNVDTIRMIKK